MPRIHDPQVNIVKISIDIATLSIFAAYVLFGGREVHRHRQNIRARASNVANTLGAVRRRSFRQRIVNRLRGASPAGNNVVVAADTERRRPSGLEMIENPISGEGAEMSVRSASTTEERAADVGLGERGAGELQDKSDPFSRRLSMH